MNRILLESHEVADDGTALLRGPRAHHVRSVLRARPGARLRVGVVNGPAGEGTVRSTTDAQVLLDCVFSSDSAPDMEPLDLLLALPRPKVLRRLVPQLAALGVRHIFLTNAWRVEKNYFDTHVLEEPRLREGLIEGLSQAGTTRLPEISIHRHLRRLLEDELDGALPAPTARLLAHPAAPVRLGRWIPAAARALIAVGPEGGWIDREVTLFKKHGFQGVSIGSRILRSDTVCLALLAVLREIFPSGMAGGE
jgi:16S rRNA (uracil1498-N3)-methyltransferase